MRGAVLVVEDDLAEICDKGPRTHTMNASREREFFCWFFFFFSFLCLVFRIRISYINLRWEGL